MQYWKLSFRQDLYKDAILETQLRSQAAHIDVHEVRIAAISAVVDLLMRHGLASFITATNTGDSSRKSSSEVNCCY